MADYQVVSLNMPFSALAGCTVVTADYLPWVRVTAASFAEHHPGAEFAVLVIDDPEPSQLRQDDPFTLLARPTSASPRTSWLGWISSTRRWSSAARSSRG